MKINKILAAGTAATLAVSSLASVASAAEKTRSWGLTYNWGILTANPYIVGNDGRALTPVQLDSDRFGQLAVQNNNSVTKGGITEAYDLRDAGAATTDRATVDANGDGVGGTCLRADTNADGIINNRYDFDAGIPVYITTNQNVVNWLSAAGGLKVTINGERRASGNYTPLTRETTLITKIGPNGSEKPISNIRSNGSGLNLDWTQVQGTHHLDETGADPTVGAAYAYGASMQAPAAGETLAILPLYYGDAPLNQFMPYEFDAAKTIEITGDGINPVKLETNDQELYFAEADKIAAYNYDFADFRLVGAAANSLCINYEDINRWGKPTLGLEIAYFFEVPAFSNNADALKVAPEFFRSAYQFTEDAQAVLDATGAIVSYDLYGEEFNDSADTDPNKGGAGNIINPLTGPLDPETGLNTSSPADSLQVGNMLVEKIADLIDGITVYWRVEGAELGESNAWLPYTDIYLVPGTLYRNEIWELSNTADYQSTNLTTLGAVVSNVSGNDVNQTYTVEDYRVGTRPLGFAGLASQVADFFNKQLNGKITFTFTDVSGVNGRVWLNGGIPSTEVGLRNVMSGANPDDFALYFNYNSTTGSLETVVDIDVDAGEVTFDISEILDDLGGLTKGSVHDLYYGMTKWTSVWNGNRGMWVSQVTLSYDDGADVAGDTADDTADDTSDDDTADDDTSDDDDDDDTADDDDDDDDYADDDDTADDDDDDTADDDDDDDVDDDDDASIDDDDDDTASIDDDDAGDDDDNQGEVEIVSGDDDDANPHTGVALAVVPAIVAAAAIVVSKKRK